MHGENKTQVLASRGQLFLIPLGLGEPQQITHDSIDHKDACFQPDGRRSLGAARAISPEGVNGATPTTDGKFVFGWSDAVALYPINGKGALRPLPGMHPGDVIASVLADGHSLLVESPVNNTSINVFRVDLPSGRRELFKEIVPADPAGVFMVPAGLFTPDGKYYA